MNEVELYLFTGPEIGERNEAIAELKQNASKKNGPLDEYNYYAGETRFADVIAQLQNESLFSSATFIVYKNAEMLKTKDDIALLDSWIKGAKGSPNTLVLVSEENGIEKKIESLVPSSHKKIFWEMFEDRKQQWVQNYFRKNGFGVTPDAIESILEMVENNTETLKSECSRFFYCFEKGYEVTEADVEKILAHNKEESAFTLFEAMADNSASPSQRLETALSILQKLLLSKNSIGVELISGLAYCFRQLRTWHNLHANGAFPSDSDLRTNGFYNKTSQTRYRKASSVWGPGATSSIISLLSSTDMSIRETGKTFEETSLSMLIYSIVMKNGAYCSEYETDIQ